MLGYLFKYIVTVVLILSSSISGIKATHEIAKPVGINTVIVGERLYSVIGNTSVLGYYDLDADICIEESFPTEWGNLQYVFDDSRIFVNANNGTVIRTDTKLQPIQKIQFPFYEEIDSHFWHPLPNLSGVLYLQIEDVGNERRHELWLWDSRTDELHELRVENTLQWEQILMINQQTFLCIGTANGQPDDEYEYALFDVESYALNVIGTSDIFGTGFGEYHNSESIGSAQGLYHLTDGLFQPFQKEPTTPYGLYQERIFYFVAAENEVLLVSQKLKTGECKIWTTDIPVHSEYFHITGVTEQGKLVFTYKLIKGDIYQTFSGWIEL